MCLLFAAGTLFTACSDDDVDTNLYGKSGVNLLAFGPSPILRTNEIRITGTNMQNVDQVIFPGAEPITPSGFNKYDNENIYVNVPDESVPGQIKLVAGKDTVTSVTKITFEEPIEVTSITPTENINPGDIITIKGEYVYNIATVTFTAGVDVSAEDFVKVSRKEVQVRVPLGAESGTITLTDGADWTLEYKTPLVIIGASVSEVTPAATDFGQTVTIKGVNLHTVTSVTFAGGVEATFEIVNNNTITATVPADAKSGAITLTTASGATVSTSEVTVPEIKMTGCSKTEDICAGDEITVTGENFDRIKQVFLGDNEITDYKISGNTLTLTIPDGTGDCDLKLVQNANISVSQALVSRKLANVVWQGSIDMAGWSGNFSCFTWDAVYETMKAAMTGAGKLTLGIETTGDNPMIKIAGSDWNTRVFENMPESATVSIDPGTTEWTLDVTAADVARAFGPGIVIYGCNYKLKYIKFVAAGAEQVLWEGEAVADDWGNQPYLLSDAGTELAAANAAEGNVVRFYITPTDTEWKLQIVEGHWGDTYLSVCNVGNSDTEGGKFTEYDLDANGGAIKLTLTQAILDKALTQQWWGGTFLGNGDNVKITKITIAPM